MRLNEMPLYLSMKKMRKYIFRLIPNFPKVVKHAIGGRMIDGCCRCINNIATINRSKRHPEYQLECIKALLVELDVLFDLIDFLAEERCISLKQSAELILQMEEIEKQCNGLRNAFENEIKR